MAARSVLVWPNGGTRGSIAMRSWTYTATVGASATMMTPFPAAASMKPSGRCSLAISNRRAATGSRSHDVAASPGAQDGAQASKRDAGKGELGTVGTCFVIMPISTPASYAEKQNEVSILSMYSITCSFQRCDWRVARHLARWRRA